MIIEDDQIVGFAIKRLVENWGHTVGYVAATGENAVEMARKIKPALILSDIDLPGMSGIEAITKIKAFLNVKVIYMTGQIDEEKRELANATKPIGILEKPWTGDELRTVLEKV